MNGRPLTIPWLANNAPALLEAWYPGTEGGNAVADVLFGKVDPSGKLPMSFPVNVGQVPLSYNELPTGRPADPNNKYTSRYLDAPNTPQYPFGYGLSYTTFSFSNLVAPSTVSRSQHVARQRRRHQCRLGDRHRRRRSCTCTRATRRSSSRSRSSRASSA